MTPGRRLTDEEIARAQGVRARPPRRRDPRPFHERPPADQFAIAMAWAYGIWLAFMAIIMVGVYRECAGRIHCNGPLVVNCGEGVQNARTGTCEAKR